MGAVCILAHVMKGLNEQTVCRSREKNRSEGKRQSHDFYIFSTTFAGCILEIMAATNRLGEKRRRVTDENSQIENSDRFAVFFRYIYIYTHTSTYARIFQGNSFQSVQGVPRGK